MLDGQFAEADAGAEILGSIGSPSPAHASATRVEPAWRRNQMPDPRLDWAERARRLALDLSGTTPTLLPDLLRAVSLQAGRLADDPFNALDNNPFIVREWLIVSQVLHAAAASLEKRFDALFQEI